MSETTHSDEELLRRNLHELAAAEVGTAGSPQSAVLVARGRRALRRRRVAAVTASLALVGIVGAAGAYAGLLDDRRDVTVASPGDEKRAGEERVVSLLKGLLPEGKVTEVSPDGEGLVLGAYLKGVVTFDDGKGAGTVSMALGRTDDPSLALVSLADCSAKPGTVGRWGPKGTCTARNLPDGSRLLLTQGREAPYREQDPEVWSARLTKPDGSTLTVTESNAPAGKGAAPSREDPPLTQEQLTTLVTAEEWRPLLDSFPRRGGGNTDPDAPSGFELVNTFKPLLPPPLKLVGNAGGTGPSGYVRLQVDDGKGGAAVEVTVDRRGTNTGDRMRIEERQGPDPWSDKGTLRWSVTAIRPGGFQVTITAYNAHPVEGEPSRSTSPLTMEQLRDIASDGAWDRYR
ncbi:hypothetical protein RND61_10235 [Streptomyces sp. TRM76323]|uniref:Aromatic ring-opening dioxygenase LigA n=1 Tax=Streptomyces tamarix TaxID=3078565 RepID=A0ABU3QI49_9ACTN|nr:hypothetical protein [Streptomyces tamarix]MDT9682443.1 hypothetical protein [Streptomyces tamarix]